MDSIELLDTPVPLIDLARMQRNIARMAEYTAAHGLALRPHVKTHKSPAIAEAQMRAGAVGLTCATTREAEVMSAAADDILVMYPPVGAARLARLLATAEDATMTVAIDSAESLDALAAAARSAGRTVQVLIELDLGMHRVGVSHAADAVTLARQVRGAGEGIVYAGVAFYPGHIREHVSEQDARLQALDRALGSLLAALSRAGLEPRTVSGGSTPAAWRMHVLHGVTEVRPGTYVFNDRTTAQIGACSWDECALTVLGTVVSTAVSGQAVVDAGSKALGREPLRAGSDDAGYAAVMEHPHVVVHAMSEEHGIIDLSRTSWRPRVGDRVRLVPNHVCIVVHLNDVLIALRDDRIAAVLDVAARGRHVPAPTPVEGDILGV